MIKNPSRRRGHREKKHQRENLYNSDTKENDKIIYLDEKNKIYFES